MTTRFRILVAALIGLALGAVLGWLIGWLARSDNAPFFVALGALAGLCGGLARTRMVRPLVLGIIVLLLLVLLAVVFTPPRAPVYTPVPPPTGATSPAPRADGTSLLGGW